MAAERRQARSPSPPTAPAAAGRRVPGSRRPAPALGGRRACLASGRQPLGPAGRASPPPRVPSRPLLSLSKLPRAARRDPRRDDGAGRRVNRATDEALAAREVRGPVTAQFGWPPAHPATHPLRPGAGGRPGSGHVAADPPRRRRRASNFTLSAVSGPTGTAHSGGPGAGASQLWGGAVADVALGCRRRRRAAGLTFRRARAASAARPPTRVFCNQSVRLIKGGATAS